MLGDLVVVVSPNSLIDSIPASILPICPILNRNNTISRLENQVRNIQHIVVRLPMPTNLMAFRLPAEDRPRHSNALPRLPSKNKTPASVFSGASGFMGALESFPFLFLSLVPYRQVFCHEKQENLFAPLRLCASPAWRDWLRVSALVEKKTAETEFCDNFIVLHAGDVNQNGLG